MPVRRRNHGLPRPEEVGQRTGSDLCLIEIRCQVDVRRADKLLQILQGHEAVVKDDMFLNTVVSDESFETQTIPFAFTC